MSNPAQHIVFYCSGEEEHRSQRLWFVLSRMTPDELRQLQWIGDWKGCLQIGLKRSKHLSIGLLSKAMQAWREQGEDMIELYGPSHDLLIFESVEE